MVMIGMAECTRVRGCLGMLSGGKPCLQNGGSSGRSGIDAAALHRAAGILRGPMKRPVHLFRNLLA
jgi:hypothetical protein